MSATDEIRARFFVRANVTTAGVSFAGAIIYAATSVWGQVATCLLLLLTCSISLGWYRATKAVRGPTWLAISGAAISLGGAALAQTPADITNVCFLAALPLLSSLILSSRETLVVSVFAGVLGLAVLWAGANGFTIPYTDPNPTATAAFNFLMLVVVLWLFVRAYEQVHALTLERVQQADRAKGTFLATISHEIRTPMNGVLGITEALLTEPLTDAQHQNLRVIQRSGQQLVSLINDLLDLSKAEAGKLTIDLHDFELERVLHDVRALFEPAAHKKGLALRFDVADEVPRRLHGDSLRLGQVLNNLVSNAVKFTTSGEVLVRVSTQTLEHVTFEVRDTGPGISAQHRARLFMAFEQGDGSTTRRHGGTGLGLALVQQLVHLMGGSVTVESSEGHGSRFWFSIGLPAAIAPPPKLALTPPRGPARPRVLVVDDNPINLAVAAQLVEKAGFAATQVASGRAALEAVATHQFSLVLMDCHMPEMDGFETTERLRAMPEFAGLPVVALTASTLPDDLEACRRSGMNDVLIKPLSLSALSAVLQRFVALAA